MQYMLIGYGCTASQQWKVINPELLCVCLCGLQHWNANNPALFCVCLTNNTVLSEYNMEEYDFFIKIISTKEVVMLHYMWHHDFTLEKHHLAILT